ncbi:MAG: DUF4177 domain-containing protein [Anaerolineales bacterium]|nr:DUF4177 domain-containing protein [Anaerolineales bacterium]
MQKWEYRWIILPHSLGRMKAAGRKVESSDYVNELGDQGWELLGIEQGLPGGGIISEYILFFKRPKGE